MTWIAWVAIGITVFTVALYCGCVLKLRQRESQLDQARLERNAARSDAALLRRRATRAQVGTDRDVEHRNTEWWMTDSHRAELDARFNDVIVPLLGGGEQP